MACLPIETYDEVLKFKNFRPCWKNAVQPLSHVSDTCYPGVRFQCHAGNFDLVQERRKRRTVPKTLFCHDLKGGYLEDRFVDGSSKHDEYRFFHWTGIDTFVYFSHKLVTIPPPGWINAAHLHGTKVLGTLITEWKEGEKIWQKITESDESVEEFADCLVEICINFGFDGYLLNVENIILPEQVTRLELFISLLYNKLHEKIPHAELLWYDSVTTEGKLEWQNELNVKNRSFMEKCDGIFLNYSWNENNLKQSAENAGKRLLDVYVGIDVFGRNFYGGGGYNSCKAVELARKYNLSLAIFAPSWVHEYLGGPHFVNMEYVFWHTLWPYLYLHGPTDLPFSTTFCQGYGEKLYNNGEVVSSNPWYNLSKQQYQPTVPSCQGDQFVDIICTAKKDAEERRKAKSKEGEEVNTDIPDEVYAKSGELITAGCVQHYSRDAFNGGGCLQITKSSSEISSHRIFTCDFKCDGEYLVSVATKPVCEDKADIIVLLKSENDTGVCRTWTLKSGVKHTSERNVVIPLKHTEIEKLRHKVDEDLFTTLCATASSDWKLRHHLIELNETIIEVRVELTPTGSSALLGLFQIYPVEQ